MHDPDQHGVITLRSILKLHPAHRTRWSGSIALEGDEILTMNGRDLADLRGNRVAMIFQEPATAFDPVFAIGRQIAETVRAIPARARPPP